jgi:nitroreductase
MDVMSAIRGRHSVRFFTGAPIPHEVLNRLVEAAAFAPSAFNSQPWRFHIATGDMLRRVSKIMSLSTKHVAEYLEMLPDDERHKAEEFFATLGDAPAAIAMSLPVSEDELDHINDLLGGGAALQNMLLAAVDLGLGACNVTFGFWVRDQLAEVLEVPVDRYIPSVIVVGYPAETPISPEHDMDVATIFE